jgi:hypothetical protein
MKYLSISFKSFNLVLIILKEKLSKKRNTLKEMVKDKKCSAEIYDKTVAECQDIEYAILEIQKGYDK